MADPTLAQRIAEFAVASRGHLPEEVRESVQMRVLDIVGICVAASTMTTSEAALGFALEQGGASQASVIGAPDRLPAAMAAFVNGVYAHSLDYDDTHLPSVLHPSASVIPAALAVAQAAGASGADAVWAMACGLEVCVRVGMAGYDRTSGKSIYFENGQHATSICGALGAAVASALLYGLDQEQVRHALAIAASMGSGIIEANRTGGTVKRLHCGWAAHAGVSAAQLAAHGFTGPPTVLEGRFGFFQAWLHGQFDSDAVTEGLGETWLVPEIVFKPYPANHFTHTAIDAAMALRQKIPSLETIDSIQLGVPGPIVRTLGEPIEVKRRPATGYMAQFSGPYVVAAALVGGGGLGLAIEDFADELMDDPIRCTLMDKVSVVADERCTKIFPLQFPCVLKVRCRSGEEFVEEVWSNRGGPGRPMSFEEILTKFQDNVEHALDDEAVQGVAAAVRRLRDLPLVDPIFEPISGGGNEEPQPQKEE